MVELAFFQIPAIRTGKTLAQARGGERTLRKFPPPPPPPPPPGSTRWNP